VVLARTKVGLLIRAGVQDREMVESLGYRIRRLFVGVFVGRLRRWPAWAA
jgi:branched-chain amino acid transport system permease protein